MATTSGYDGGIGGKFRRRPLRRQAPTPYDRPASAARGGAPRGLVAEAGGGNGWLSKIVDPASRFIAGSASRLFASVFQKRLTAPPAQPETRGTNDSIRKGDSQVVSAKPLHEVEEDKTIDLTSPPNNSGKDSVSEVEQILKQKTLTRDEFERLTDILRSRIINSDSSGPIAGSENINNNDVRLPAIAFKGTHEEPSKPPTKLSIPEDEAASPAELAKAYMGSRTSKLPSSALSLRNHVFPEDNKMPSTHGANPLFSVGQRSVFRAPAAAERPQDHYLTTRPLSRSAIFKMSRSPYFRSNATSNVKGRRYSHEDPSSSFQTPKAITRSGGRELLKRGSSVLDGDLPSFGSIRRTRQKFIQTSPSNGMPLMPAGKLRLTYNNEVNGESTSVQKPQLLNERNYDATNMQSSEKESSRGDQSSKIAMKISQELSKFVPSPKDKSSKIVSFDESNMKLSRPITDNQSPRKFKDLDTSESRIFGSLGGSTTPGIKNPTQKQFEASQNDSSTSAGSGVNLAPENFKHSGAMSSLNFERSKSTIEGSSKANNIAPILRETSAAPLTLKERVGVKISLGKCVGPETAAQDHYRLQSSLSSDLKVSKMEEKGYTGTISENGMDFCFPAAPISNSFSLPPTPTMPSPLVQKTTQKDQLAAPLLTFGSKDVPDVAVSSTEATDNVTDPSQDGIKSSAKSSTTQVPILHEVGEAQKSRVIFKSFGNVDLADKSEISVPLFTFGVKTDEGSSNGSLYSSSLSFSAAGAIALSANSASMSSNSIDPSLGTRSFISSASVSVNVPIFKFGSDTVPQLLDKSNISQLDRAKASPFSITYSNTGNSTVSTIASAQLSSGTSCSTLATSLAVPSMEISYVAQVESTLSKSNTVFGSTQSSRSTTSSIDCVTKTSSAVFTAPTGSIFSTKKQSESEASHFSKSSAGQFGSFSSSTSFGLESSSSSGFGGFQFGAATSDSKPSSSNSAFSSSTGAGSSNSTTSFSSAPQSSNSTGFSFASPVHTSSTASSFQQSTSSFASAFSSNSPTSATTFSFMATTSASSSSPFVSSLGSPFPFTSASATSAGQSVFGGPSTVGFNSASPGTGRMNTEDSMTVETNVPASGFPTSVSPASGVPCNLPATPVFGASEVEPAAPVFQFGGNQNPLSSNPSPFQAAGSAEFSAGGSFSLGSGGNDKSGRRIIKVRRDKLRKK